MEEEIDKLKRITRNITLLLHLNNLVGLVIFICLIAVMIFVDNKMTELSGQANQIDELLTNLTKLLETTGSRPYSPI